MSNLKEIIRNVLRDNYDQIEMGIYCAVNEVFDPSEVAEYLLAFMPNADDLKCMILEEAAEMFGEILS